MEIVEYYLDNAVQVKETLNFFANNSNLGEVKELDYSQRKVYCVLHVLVR